MSFDRLEKYFLRKTLWTPTWSKDKKSIHFWKNPLQVMFMTRKPTTITHSVVDRPPVLLFSP